MGWIGSERRVVGGRVWIFFGCCGVVLGEDLLSQLVLPLFFEPTEPLITPPEKSLISEYNCVDLTVS
jgi:hypothetical protein